MIDSEGYPFPQDDLGNFVVPRELRKLLWIAAGTLHSEYNPVIPHFRDDGSADTILLTIDADPGAIAAVLDTAWVFGQPYLDACENGANIQVLAEVYGNCIEAVKL